MLVLTLSHTEHTTVVSLKNVTKVVWYILVQSNSLNNTVSMVSGVSVQVSGDSKRDEYAVKPGGPKDWKLVSVRVLKPFRFPAL